MPPETPASVPSRCVLIVDNSLPVGRAANAAAVMALTIGQRHPGLVGAPLIDASGFTHPGLIPIGIAVLSAGREQLAALRHKGLDAGCDVIAFPSQGQETTSYPAFLEAIAQLPTDVLTYVGIALVGDKKVVSKIVANLTLLK